MPAAACRSTSYRPLEHGACTHGYTTSFTAATIDKSASMPLRHAPPEVDGRRHEPERADAAEQQQTHKSHPPGVPMPMISLTPWEWGCRLRSRPVTRMVAAALALRWDRHGAACLKDALRPWPRRRRPGSENQRLGIYLDVQATNGGSSGKHFRAAHWKSHPRVAFALSRVEAADRRCVHWIGRHRRQPLDKLFVLGSHSGQVGIPWTAALLVLHLTSTAGKRISVPRAVTITVGTWLLAHLGKRADHRLRPCQDGDLDPLIKCPRSSSMPSDEAACAFAAAAYAARAMPRLRPQLLAAATFTAASRVYVGAHYPTDVLAGALLGAITGRAAGNV